MPQSSAENQDMQSQPGKPNGRPVLAAAENERVAWHTLTGQEALDRLAVDREGLSEEVAATIRQEVGSNTFPSQEPPSFWSIVLHQFLSPLIYILIAAAVVSLFIGEITDAVFIGIVLLINAGLGTYQEYRAEQNAAALQRMLKIYATVRRDGREQNLDAEDLVPGDIVLLESGHRVPADIRLLDTHSLTVDESFLTGESAAATKNAAAELDADTEVSDRSNLAYAGATVLSGRATGVVVAIGLHTEIGKIAAATSEGEATKAPLVVRMDQFVQYVSFAVLGAVVLLIAIAMWQGTPFTEVFFLSVALAVSAIPEGLPVAMTVALSIAASRMSQKRVIARKMTAVEGLGSCTLIASDKTGTLTVNRQTVKTVALPSGARFNVSGEGYNGDGTVSESDGEALDETHRARLETLTRAGVLANEGSLYQHNGAWQQAGDAVDVGFLALGYKLGLEPQAVRGAVEQVGSIPYESERQYAAIAVRDDDEVRVAMKGATERVLDFCDTIEGEGEPRPIDRDAIIEQADQLAAEGYRVIAVAQGTGRAPTGADGMEEDDLSSLTLLGLIGMIDPLRPEAKQAVDTCQAAGVEVAMITGDHPATALAIARDLGLAATPDDVVVGRELPETESPHDLAFADRVRDKRVFARVSPLQKLRIVEVLRADGHFVAVTGDGVNDAPALRTANIGVAMGSGTDVAKDTASIIVTDDNFASIVDGVREGRIAYENVRKVIYLLVSTGAAEIALFLAAVLIGLPLPLLAIQLLWLNLVTNGIQGVALAFEGGEPDTMQRKPRDPAEGIFNPLMIWQVLLSGGVMFAGTIGLWYWLLGTGATEEGARSLVLTLMVLFQNFHVFNTRSEHTSAFRVPLRNNRFVVLGVPAVLALHLLAINTPFMQSVLEVAPLSFGQFGLLVALAASILVVLELFKLVQRR